MVSQWVHFHHNFGIRMGPHFLLGRHTLTHFQRKTPTPTPGHKAWCSAEEVPYCFSRSSVNFKVTRHKKWSVLTRIECFWTVTLVLYSPMALKWCTELDMVQKRCPIVFWGHPSNWMSHRLKNQWFESNLRPGTPVLEVIFKKYLIFEFSTGNSFLLLGL